MVGRDYRVVRRSSFAAVLATVAALVPAAPASGGTLDQQQTDASQGHSVGTVCPMLGPGGELLCVEPQSQAQTFTAGISGALDQVDLVVERGQAPAGGAGLVDTTDPLIVEIRTLLEGCPSATVLASERVAAGDVPPLSPLGQQKNWLEVPFSDPATVLAGTQYAIVLHIDDKPGLYHAWGAGAGADYPAGQRCRSATSPPTTWEPGTSDLAFKTYVAGPSTPGCRGQSATRVGTDDDETIFGTPERDVIAALGGRDRVFGLGGNDLICLGAGRDVGNGGAGKDHILGRRGNDILKGRGGKDRLTGNRGRDVLKGGGARDVCKGGAANDLARCEVEKSAA